MTPRHPSTLLPLLALLALPACASPGEPWAIHRELLERNRDRWTDERTAAYRYDFRMSCECIPGFAGTVEITVLDDRITALVPQSSQVSVPEDQWPAFETVDEMFALIERAIDERAHQFHVEYDAALGYPTQISLDFDETHVDDELSIHVSALELL